ncbi:MAG TPA: phosphotransferase [Isosphaeraceae bacterium]|jgi:thiamine kinase-like enzyme
MAPDVSILRRLQALDCWQGPITVEPLPGGITNRNYLVRDARTTRVARLGAERTLLGIDRRNEVACQRAAWACGVGPAVVHHEDGLLISEHLPGRTLTRAEVADPAVLAALAAALRRLHGAWDRLAGEMLYFCVFQVVRTYGPTAARLGARLPADVAGLLEDARRLAHRVAPFRPVLCHNDLLAANLIFDGVAVRLVDWEYAGMGHPLFDLANAAAGAALPEERDIALLAAYRGAVDPRELAELRLLKAMSLLREALWAAIQSVVSELDFDYLSYAEENFLAYRRARAQLEMPAG